MAEEGSSLMPTPDGLNLSKIAADEPRRQASEEGSAAELQIDQDQSSSSNFLEITSEPEVKKKKNSYFIFIFTILFVFILEQLFEILFPQKSVKLERFINKLVKKALSKIYQQVLINNQQIGDIYQSESD